MKRLDKKVCLALLLVLLIGTKGFAQLEEAAYGAWSGTSYEGKVAFVQGMMVGAYWVAVAYMSENQGKQLPRIDHLVPKGVDGATLVDLIDRVYMDAKNRNLPIVYLVVNWKKYYALYAGGL